MKDNGVVVAEGKFLIKGITPGNFSVCGSNFHTDHITPSKCQELIAKGCTNIVPVAEPTEKKPATPKSEK